MSDKDSIKNLYAAIIRQALADWKIACRKDDRRAKREIRKFFRSEWCDQILDVLELDIRIINDKYNILK